ncbi:MAG: hypothetical protein JOZ15_00065, partial [Acidobacteria bacterium]|nr:hypothetical protein [Acidobacteriota bacterium]
RRRRVAWVVINIGLAAALSLLPYAWSLGAARDWSQVVVYRPDLSQIVRLLGATVAPLGAAWSALAVLAVAGTVWTLARRRRQGDDRPAGAPGPADNGRAASTSAAAPPAIAARVQLFAVLALALGLVAQLAFQLFLGYTPRAWYDLPLLALAACALEPLAAGLCRLPLARLARIVLALALAAAALPSELPRLRLRMTNVDLIARRLAITAAADDLVLVLPWYYGVSFNRYYAGPASWTTLPDLPDHQVHRYDLIKARLASPRPIDDVLEAVRRTLSDGHRVWLVGQLRFPPPGQAPPLLPPAPRGPAGWHDLPYVESWSMQLGAMLRAHAGALARVPAPSADPVSPLENMTLVVAAGWHS